MLPITIRYAFRPVRRSLATGWVADLFGLAAAEPAHVVAENVALDIRAGDLVLFTGPSGSGKSSLLRAAGEQLDAVDAMGSALPEVPLVDSLPGKLEERMNLLAACGLSEARLLLRTHGELSDGQRYRFRLAHALAAVGRPLNGDARFLIADEFAANLDRTLAKVLAFNLRKLVTRTGIGMLLATTHEDVLADLRPDLHIRCRGEGDVRQSRDESARDARPISFVDELSMEEGTHRLAAVREVALSQPSTGIRTACCFAQAPR